MSDGKKLNFYKKESTGKKTDKFVKYAFIALAAFGITLLLLSGLNSRNRADSPAGTIPFPELSENGTKVVFAEFSDFECPYCARAQGTVSSLKAEYAGKVNFVFKHFPIHGATAEKAAEATECARDQGLFEPYHLLVFENYNSLTVQKLKDFSGRVGADTALFDSCLDSGQKSEVVKADYNKGVSLGIRATPTFFVNGKKIEGAVDISEFRKAINSELVLLVSGVPEESK